MHSWGSCRKLIAFKPAVLAAVRQYLLVRCPRTFRSQAAVVFVADPTRCLRVLDVPGATTTVSGAVSSSDAAWDLRCRPAGRIW